MKGLSPSVFFDLIELLNEETKKANGEKEINFNI